MTPLTICTYDDPVLRQTAAPIETIEPRHHTLAMDMAQMMYEHRGIGLAANQVGLTERIVIVDVLWPETEDRKEGPLYRPTVMINPEVLEENTEDEEFVEGCLSLPGIEGAVWRPTKIRYRHQNLKGEWIEAQAEGLLARCIQHEIDHLNGHLFIDRMADEDRQKLAGQLSKLRRSRQKTTP